MRRFSFPVGVALVLASTLALAVPQQKVGQFEPLGASSIAGDARVQAMQEGSRVQGHLDNLTPGIEYQAVISADNTCGGTDALVVATFTANPAGKANFNQLVARDISTISSISVNRSGDPTVLACAGLQ